MEPFQIHNAKDDDHKSEEILDLLPPRFREISGSSTAMESFNLMNDDLISHRIIPRLDRCLRNLIANARPGLIANRLGHLVEAAPPSPRICSLLFRLIPKGVVSEMKFMKCSIRDKRLSPYPHHVLTALTIPHWAEIEKLSGLRVGDFVEVIGHKIIFWKWFLSCYILNAELNFDRAFQLLDTSTILGELPAGILKVVEGDRLILLWTTPSGTSKLSTLDVNSERWSVLPEPPAWFPAHPTAILWKGKLYIVEINDWVFGLIDDATEVVPMHFDFDRNMWVMGGDENTAFARRFMSFFPRFEGDRHRKLVIGDRGRCIVSSKSGTLYAISHAPQNYDMIDNVHDIGDSDEYPIGNIYAMDDLIGGWRQIECRKSEHSQQVDPFKLPKLPHKVPQHDYLRGKMNCWEINEHDILLVVLQSLNLADGMWARYAWWIFNKEDGVKNYGWEELNRSALENIWDISLMKLEM